jgi:Asp-tRNA(Asn)/Glu-tRNA(Gln) amidotransferase B subunit
LGFLRFDIGLVPLMTEGSLQIVLPNYTKNIRISHLKLEQDSGKSIHNAHPHLTYIDLNRAGVGKHDEKKKKKGKRV